MCNKEEMYTVLDEFGNSIRAASWEEVHEKGLLHEVVAAFVFRDKSCQELLIQKRSLQMKQDPGKWNHSVGGHVTQGETVSDAIRREMQEELFGRTYFPNILFERITSFFQEDMPGNKEKLTLFRVIYPGPFCPDKKELDGLPVWVSLNFLLSDIEKHPDLYTVSFVNSIREYKNGPS